MQFTDIWIVLTILVSDDTMGWLIKVWYEWGVFFAFGINIIVLFLISIRQILSSTQPIGPHGFMLLRLMGWVAGLGVFLILPSLVIKISPNLLLFSIGFNNNSSLQAIGYEGIQIIGNILRLLAWEGIVGFTVVIYPILFSRTFRLFLMKGYLIQMPLSVSPHKQTQATIQHKPSTQEYGTPPPPISMDAPTPPFNAQMISAPTDRDILIPLSLNTNDEYIDELTPLPPNSNDEYIDELTSLPSNPLPVAAWLRVKNYKGSEKYFELTGDKTDIGRMVGNIRLSADSSISGHHAMITHQKEKVNLNYSSFILNDYSRHQSTWVNETKLSKNEKVKLRSGDKIRFGDSEFVFYTLPWPEIIIGSRGDEKIKQQMLPLTIGRGKHNDIDIDKPNILDLHARIEVDYLNKQFVLVPEEGADLKSFVINNKSATYLDPAPWPLPDGCRFKISDRVFKINY